MIRTQRRGPDGPISFVASLSRPSVFCAFLVLLAPLIGCASRPETGFLSPVAEGATGASSHDVLVATTRERDSREGTMFNGERARALDFAELTVSVPPTHKPGNIEWASTAPGSAATDFVVRDETYLDGDKQFLTRLNAQLATRPRGSRKVLVFVHGYNTMFAEGLYRGVQVVEDAKSGAVPVLFTWASRGQLTGYVYDNNSATAARDDLERTLRLVFASDADQINILAHSMGNWVTVEALRQIKISGRLPPMQKLGSIVLTSPDIDIDVFKSQMRRFGKPQKPFYIVLSRDDKALQLSKFIAGGQDRLGAEANVEELAALGAVVIDMTEVAGADSSNHDKFAQLAEVAPQLAAVLQNGVGAVPGSASQSQGAPADALGSVVALPFRLLGGPIRIISGQ
ncbi:MAG: alpha/beta hydrolase [Roseiarcus sp.]|jgi:esterase/lipase superfamily enzyme